MKEARLNDFTQLLWKLNGYKDPSRVTNRETYRYVYSDPKKTLASANPSSIPNVVLWLEPAEYLDRGIEG